MDVDDWTMLAKEDVKLAKKDIAAAVAAGWIVPATVETVNLEVFYPILAFGSAYYAAAYRGYGIVPAYMVGGAVYGITMYYRLPDLEQRIDAFGVQVKTSIEASKSKIIAWIWKQLKGNI